MRSGIPLLEIHRQLRGIASDRAVGLGPKKILSVPDAIGMALEDWWRDHTQGVQQDLLGDAAGRRRQRRAGAPPRPPGRGDSARGTGRAGDGTAVRRAGMPDRYARRDRVVHRHLSRLRLTARVRGRMREVPRVRVLGVRVAAIGR